MTRCESPTTPIPPMKDLTTANITENVHIVNSICRDPRLRYLLDCIVTHLHEFCRETQLSTEEWQTGIQFLTEIGQISDELRHEMIALSDVLGVSLLVDSINHPRQEPATEGTVLGPFHTHDAKEKDNGAVLHDDPDGTQLLVICSIKDTDGNLISDVKVDVWEGDSKGIYDVQNPNRTGPDGRGVLHSDADGYFFFKAIVPVPYPIPMDGPVGKMLQTLGRHPNRPSHVHFMLDKPGYDLLITALYPRGDPYETSDPVFGVKETLIVDLSKVTDPAMASKYNVDIDTPLLTYDFVLLTDQQARDLRKQKAVEEMEKQKRNVIWHNGLLVPAAEGN